MVKSTALISTLWFISICVIKNYHPFSYNMQPTPKQISIVCDKGIDTLLEVIESKEYADTKHATAFEDFLSLKRTRDEYYWERIES